MSLICTYTQRELELLLVAARLADGGCKDSIVTTSLPEDVRNFCSEDTFLEDLFTALEITLREMREGKVLK